MPFLRDNENICQLPELLEGLVLIEKFKLDYFKRDSEICFTIFLRLYRVDKVPEIVLKADVFKSLPESLVKDILLYDFESVPLKLVYHPNVLRSTLKANQIRKNIILANSTKDRFNAFVFWFSNNKDCSDETKMKIVDSFDLSKFSGEELVTIVRKSGFFSEAQIELGLLKIIEEKDDKIQLLEDRLRDLQPGE